MPSPLGFFQRPQVENLRYSRLQICATGPASSLTVVYPADSFIKGDCSQEFSRQENVPIVPMDLGSSLFSLE